MELYCTRPGCPRPTNVFADLDDSTILRSVQQKFCTSCGMPLILDNRYLSLKLLGQGGFGAAFLARDRRTPAMRLCVVKQFQPSGSLTPEQLKTAQRLFEREAEVLEQIGNAHPLIPDLFASFDLTVPNPQTGQPHKLFYLVQEYVDGETMEEELIRQGPLPKVEVLEVLTKILKILQFVHEQGAIHRDIKPSNIMRHRNGQLYLLDFGAVKQATKGAVSHTSTGIYSLGFAPPEQVNGSEVYASTDLYALAVTCLMLLTGKQPTELYDAYTNEWKWRNYAQLNSRIAAVLDRMLLPTPSQRYQSATEVLAALAQAASGAAATPSPNPGVTPAPGPAPVVRPSAATTPPAPHPVAPAATPAPPKPVAPIAPIAPATLLGRAAFTGMESCLLAIALFSLPLPPAASATLWLGSLVGLVVAQKLRLIEQVEQGVIGAISLALVLLIPFLHTKLALLVGIPLWQSVLMLTVMAGLAAIALTSLVRLVYLMIFRQF